MKITKGKITENLIYIMLMFFCFIELFGFNVEHIEESIVYKNIVIPYVNINITIALAIISISIFFIFILMKKVQINNLAFLLFIRIYFYLIPLAYINDGSIFKIGTFYAIIQCFLSFIIGFDAENIDFNKIVKILFFYTIGIFIEELYTLLKNDISVFSKDIKWFMIIPLGRNNYISCILIPTYGLIYNYSKNSAFKIAFSIIIFIGVLATGSRLALLLYLIYLIFILKGTTNFNLTISKKRILIIFILLPILILLINNVFYSNNVNPIYSRFSSTSLYENRLKVYKESIINFINHPFFGRSAFYYKSYDVVKSHNFILESLIQTGIVGTYIYIYVLYLIFVKIQKIRIESIKSAIKSFVVLWLIQGMMEPNLFGLGSDFYFWLIVGIGLSYTKIDEVKGEEENDKKNL